ncbi:MAG: SDR family NAD(P)-dependent oxidoreductase [Woeseiaceae bacterium]|nr:SDR family NAD(P)-dependent oxidoreductase [Woeseiaceae bacterium]
MTNAGHIDVSHSQNLAGETILVTGASGNIGQGIARRLAAAGARIVVHYHQDTPSARSLAAELETGAPLQADLGDEAAVDALLSTSQPTMVVNNAAVQPVEPLGGMSAKAWRGVLAANLDGAFLVTQRAARLWGDDGGAIVNVASIEGADPAAGHAHYATSKAGLLMFTRAAALEYGGRGIRVNAVSPGLIDHEGLSDDWPDGVARWLERAPLGRLGTPQDVADAVWFLLSPAARWISGTNLVVDGGMSAQSRW